MWCRLEEMDWCGVVGCDWNGVVGGGQIVSLLRSLSKALAQAAVAGKGRHRVERMEALW